MKALVLEDIHPSSQPVFASSGFRFDIRSAAMDEETLIATLADADVLGLPFHLQGHRPDSAKPPVTPG